MLKILVVFHDNNLKSGATASMLSIVKFWKINNIFKVDVIVPKSKGSLGEELDNLKINYHIIDYDMVRYNVDKNIFKRFIKYMRGWYRILRDLKNIFFNKSLSEYREVNYIYSNTSSIYFGLFLSIFLKKKHIWHFREFGLEDQNCKHLIGDNIFYYLANRLSDKIIVISISLEDKIKKYIGQSKVIKVYNDIDSTNIYKKKYISFNKNLPLKLLVTGAIIPNKGQEFLIDVLARLKKDGIPFELGIAGHGKDDYILHLKEKCKRNNISEHVKFHGFVTDMSKLLDYYNISVITSKKEAFGRVTIESMISGLLVICSDSGANIELVSEKNGYIYKNEDLESLVDILKKIYNEDETVKVNKILNARKFSHNFTLNLCAKKISETLGSGNEI